MDVANNPLPDNINPNTFPAKLWHLVNNPAYECIRWDHQGEIVMIDQHLFERQILSPGTVPSDNICAFKTTNYSSFVRQLNLYGFRKAESSNTDQALEDSRPYHFFCNPNFKRNHPELVVSLRRLTVDNKAKLQAGMDVSCQLLKRCQRSDEDGESRDKNLKRRFASLLSPTHQQSPHLHHLHKTQAMTAHSGTPVPPRYLMRRSDGAGLSPTVFSTAKGMPVPLSHHYNTVASNPSVMNVQQGLPTHVNHGNPNFTSFIPRNSQCQHGFYPAACYHSNLVSQQAGLFSPQRYYQTEYRVNMLDLNQDLQQEKEEVKKCDIDLDRVFQIADEMMPIFPNTRLVKVENPEKPDPGLGPSSNNSKAALVKNSGSTTTANPVCAVPVIMAVSGGGHLVTYKQLDDSVVSVPERMPGDHIFQVTSDHVVDDEIINVEVSEIVGDSSLD